MDITQIPFNQLIGLGDLLRPALLQLLSSSTCQQFAGRITKQLRK